MRKFIIKNTFLITEMKESICFIILITVNVPLLLEEGSE